MVTKMFYRKYSFFHLWCTLHFAWKRFGCGIEITMWKPGWVTVTVIVGFITIQLGYCPAKFR